MKPFLVAVALAICCFGCEHRSSPVSRSVFFASHDAQAYFESVAKAKGYELGERGGWNISNGAPADTKNYTIAIKGDSAVRDKLMREYLDYVARALRKTGAAIAGRGVRDDIKCFSFEYRQLGNTGIIRANSTMNADGFIEIDVFMYEHN